MANSSSFPIERLTGSALLAAMLMAVKEILCYWMLATCCVDGLPESDV
jgi:hypothetical protein